MKKLAAILITWSCVWILPAQQPDETAKRALEREVKTSGAYLYGEAVANKKDEAVKAARVALITEINKEILNNHDWQFANSIQAKDVEYYTDMIDLVRGNKFRVIAYVKQENLTALFNNYESPEVKLTDKDTPLLELDKIQQTAASPTVDTIKSVQPVKVAASAIAPEKPQFAIEEDTLSHQSAVGSQMSAIESSDILKQIVSASSPRQIQTILDSNKKNGKAAYGTMDKLIQPEVAYLIVLNQTGEIVAILDKGSVNHRKDLISGETYGKEIFNNNHVIWFQLF